MTSNNALKTLARQRAALTGQTYQEALADLRAQPSGRIYPPVPSESSCVGGCLSTFRATDAVDRDGGSLIDCSRCTGYVCVECGQALIAEAFERFADCASAIAKLERDARLTTRCAGRTCISRQRAGTSDSDSASNICESCDGYICFCGRVPVETYAGFCDPCYDDVGDAPRDEGEDRLKLLEELDDLASRICKRGGGSLRQVRRTLDKS